MPNKLAYLLVLISLIGSCMNLGEKKESFDNWENTLEERLPLLGHRNWILIVDKAFPLQNGEGIEVIYTGDSLLNVLNIVLEKLEQESHIKPIIYTDNELQYLTPELVPGINRFKKELFEVLPVNQKQILHDTVFVEIKKASELFYVLVLKTDELIPYSSVFIELDCKYWSGENEKELRSKM
jgi:D-ribose pyranose/furanose isomerase RbsD